MLITIVMLLDKGCVIVENYLSVDLDKKFTEKGRQWYSECVCVE